MTGSIFYDKSVKPDEQAVKGAIGNTYTLWKDIKSHITGKFSTVLEEWNFPGKKYGWSFRMKYKKTHDSLHDSTAGLFYVAFVFGKKAIEPVMESTVPETIKEDLINAREYIKGRGVRIKVKNQENVETIKMLIDIKMAV